MKNMTDLQLKCLIQDTVNRDQATHDAAVRELNRRRRLTVNIMGDGPFIVEEK